MNPEEFTEDDWFDLGVIGRPHGLRGEVRVHLFDAGAEEIAQLATDQLRATFPGKRPQRTLKIAGARFNKECWLVQFAGIGDRDAAEELRDGVLAVRASELWPAGDGEYFEHELTGVEVLDHKTGERIGEIVRVENSTGNDLLVVRGAAGNEFLLPFAAAFLREVNLAEKRMRLELPEGLIELNET